MITEQIERTSAEVKQTIKELEEELEGSTKSKRGRPSKFTPEVVTKLLAAFRMAFNDTEAALYAGISRKTFYDYINEHPDFRNKVRRAKIEPNIKAKEVVVNAINSGDLRASQWWLERKAANEFSTKPQLEPEIPPELKPYVETAAGVLESEEKLIAMSYRTAIFKLREQERANNRSRNGKPSPKEEIYTKLLELPDDKLSDHVGQEITATGQDIAGVRQWLLSRIDSQSMYQFELDRAKHWNDID